MVVIRELVETYPYVAMVRTVGWSCTYVYASKYIRSIPVYIPVGSIHLLVYCIYIYVFKSWGKWYLSTEHAVFCRLLERWKCQFMSVVGEVRMLLIGLLLVFVVFLSLLCCRRLWCCWYWRCCCCWWWWRYWCRCCCCRFCRCRLYCCSCCYCCIFCFCFRNPPVLASCSPNCTRCPCVLSLLLLEMLFAGHGISRNCGQACGRLQPAGLPIPNVKVMVNAKIVTDAKANTTSTGR